MSHDEALQLLERLHEILRGGGTTETDDLEALARSVVAARQRAEEAHRASEDVLAMLSHELRTPLNAIVGWTSMLRHADMSPAQREHALAVIDRNARAQTRLIDDLLDVSAMARGRIRLRRDAISLRPIVGAALDATRPAAESKGVQVHWHCDDGDLTVRGDADRLQQVVYNVLGNAIKFTPAGGHVTVQVRTQDDTIVVRVEDTGPGIAPDFLPHVFDRFAQGARRAKPAGGSLGLGLAIARQLVELHGGTIRAESGGLGKGAAFTMTLPTLSPRRRVPPALPAAVEPMPAAPLLGLRVLLVEAEPATREAIAVGLTRHGAIVAKAATVVEATHLLDEFQPDLLLTEIGLPASDSYRLLEALQSRGRQIPAIGMTSYARTGEASPIASSGYWRSIDKPVDIGELVSAIATVTAMREGATQG